MSKHDSRKVNLIRTIIWGQIERERERPVSIETLRDFFKQTQWTGLLNLVT